MFGNVYQPILLYLILKSVHAIGRNHDTWRALHHTSALTRH